MLKASSLGGFRAVTLSIRITTPTSGGPEPWKLTRKSGAWDSASEWELLLLLLTSACDAAHCPVMDRVTASCVDTLPLVEQTLQQINPCLPLVPTNLLSPGSAQNI